tara:strand:- start:6683 stop:8239 length:1557 start_codon:yes stop_codon:yes gene_type:complete
MAKNLLEINNLDLTIRSDQRTLKILNSINLNIQSGKITGLVGHSGSGKTMIARFILGLLPKNAKVKSGEILYNLKSIINKRHQLRGNKIAVVFQDPLGSMNPLYTVSQHFTIILKNRYSFNKDTITEHTKKCLNDVELINVPGILDKYPHQLSGGQAQRVMIALTISVSPELIIADEITTALDANLKIQTLELLLSLKERLNSSIILITHDLLIAKRYCDKINIIQNGAIIEQGKTKEIFENPKHNYTKTLLSKIKSVQNKYKVSDNVKTPLVLRVENISKTFGGIKILNSVSLNMYAEKTLGIIGESGSGKSTLAKIILNILPADSGSVSIINNDTKNFISNASCTDIGIVLQNPLNSLNPKMKIAESISEPLILSGYKDPNYLKTEVYNIMERVKLSKSFCNRYPHSLSGGQRQRVAIARALILKPKILILDEPTSSLDLTVQDSIIDLLMELQKDRKISYLFISHDIDLVSKVSNQISVIYNGEIIETGSPKEIIKKPKKDYTKSLIRSVYELDI